MSEGILMRVARWLWRRKPREPKAETVLRVAKIADSLRSLGVPELVVRQWVSDCWHAYRVGESPPPLPPLPTYNPRGFS